MGVMNRVCSCSTTASDCPSQPLTERKSNTLSVTTPSQSASHSKKNAFFDFATMFYDAILFFSTFILSFWRTTSRWYNLYCYAFFHFSTKVYSAKYFLDEIQKHDTDFSINFHYYCLLFLMLLKWYATVDLKICQNIRLH